MRILISGASGLIGTELQRRAGLEHEVRVLVRRDAVAPHEYRWDPDADVVPDAAIEWADAVVSLSGASLSRLPWTRRYRAEMRRSRIAGTGALARAIVRANRAPAAWVAGSAVGYYGDRPGELLTEASDAGRGFLTDLVTAWEAATGPAADRTRVVLARTGLVLARRGALKPLMVTTRVGLGATVGDGRQHWPWIGLDDEARALLHLATSSGLSGPVNLAGPEPATSKEITTAIARGMRRPHLLRLPRTALRTAMGVAADELLLADQRVRPQALAEDGFVFETPTAVAAVGRVTRAV